MADINVDVNLPNPITVDVTSPTQAASTNISIPGPQGPTGPRGAGSNINGLTPDFLYITGRDGIIVSSNNVDTIFISGNSGYFQSAVNSLTTNLNSTGSSLNNSINSLSGLFTEYTGNLDNNYATDTQLANTGSTLNIKIDNLSGYVNSQDTNISNNLASTGSSLQSNINTLSSNLNSTGSNLENKITSLSGTLTGNYLTTNVASSTYATINNLNSTGTTLNSNINSLSGTLTSNYATITNLSNTGSTLVGTINSLSGTLTSNYATITNLASTGATLTSSINSLNSAFTGFTGNLDLTYATDTQLQNTGSTLSQNINSLSGTLTGNYYLKSNPSGFITGVDLSSYLTSSTASSTYATITNLNSTGNTLNSNINSLSGTVTGNYVTKSNGQFTNRPTVNGTGILLSGEAASLPTTILYTTGNQIKSGRLIIGDTIVDENYPYTLSVQSNNNNTWLEILNNSGAGEGVFFGIQDNNFEQYNYQGGDILFFTSENVSDGLVRLTIKNDGKVGIGTSSPSEKLEVNGNIKASGASFIYRPTVNGTGVLLSGDIPYVQTNSYFYVDATRTDSYVENGNILYPYKTLSGAYNAAKNIASFHNPTYITLLSPIAENLTIDKGYINLVGNNTNKNDPIRITGSLVFAATGIGSTITDNNFSIAGLGVTATSNNKCILFSGNNPQRLFIQDCWLIAKDNGTCLYSNNTNTTSRLQGDILKLSPEGVNTTAIDIVSGTSSISFAETSSSASVLAYVRNNSTLNISNSQIETAGAKAFQVENTARLTLLNSVLTNTANPSTGIFLKDASSTAVVVGSAISVPANANSYAINGVANSYLFYKNLYFSINAFGQSTESKIGNNVNKNLINSYDPVVYSIGNQTISGNKSFAQDTIFGDSAQGDFLVISGNNFTVYGSGNFTSGLFVNGNAVLTGINLSAYATVANLASTGSTLNNSIISLSGTLTGNYLTSSSASNTYATIINLASTGSTLNTKIDNLSGVSVLTFGNQNISGIKTFNDGLATKYISGVSGSSLNIIGFSGEVVSQPNRAINIQAGHGGTTIPIGGGAININAGNSAFFSANTSNINLTAGTGTNNSAGGINIYAGASPNYAGTNTVFGNIDINNSSSINKTINIYRSGSIGGFPLAQVGVLIDNNKVDVNNGMVLQVSGVNVTPSLYATSANLVLTGSNLNTQIENAKKLALAYAIAL